MPIPPDDPNRKLAHVCADDPGIPHLSLVGDTYTVLLTGKDTSGRYCLIDMYVPPGGGPPPHRHDFEESFTVLEGEMEATFRGAQRTVKAGETIHIPANAPHQFHNAATHPARLLCICAPASQEDFFTRVAVPLASRTSPPPPSTPESDAEFKSKAAKLASKYKTEFLEHA
jgi:quercetin dioxygenase-like cupin family protein